MGMFRIGQFRPEVQNKWLDLEKQRFGPWDESCFDDLRPIEVHRIQGVGAPDSVALTESVYSWAFDNNVSERLTYVFHVPHTFKLGSRPVFHLHGTHNEASPTGTQVRWKTTWYHAKGYSTGIFQSTGTAVSATQTVSAQFVHDIFGEDLLPCPLTFVPDIEPDSLIIVVLERDATHVDDDFAHDYFVLTADLHIEKERDGTLERNRPFSSEGF